MTTIYHFTLAGSSSMQASAKIKQCYDDIAGRDAVHRVWSATEIESPQKLQLFLKWKTETNRDCRADQETICEQLNVMTDMVSDVLHVDFHPACGVSMALSAPVTEVATFYFDDAPPETALEGVKTLIEALENADQNILGWAYGTTREVVEREGVRGRANVLLVGWETVEAHLSSHDTQALKENIHRLTTPEVKAIEMHHVRATSHDRAQD